MVRFIRKIQERQAKLFEKGGRLEKLYPIYEANDTFLFTPGHVTRGAAHVRDSLDLKRMMMTVVIALAPCMFMAMYNTGYQAFHAIEIGAGALDNWQTGLYNALGLSWASTNFLGCVLYGALFYIPVYIVTLAAGGLIEVVFAVVRKHEINEGFLVTSALFPLTLPPTIPLWQVALGIMFGVFFGKEIFGGVGMNIFNPALVARVFLFFAYPAQISGDAVWIAANTSPDHYSGATSLAYSGATLLSHAVYGAPGVLSDGTVVQSGLQALRDSGVSWIQAFLGLIPGSMGETSKLFCLFGAFVLIYTGIGSWRTMAGGLAGSFVMVITFNLIGSSSNPFFDVPVYWHWVIGSFAFAMVFMATDPVSSAFTAPGQLIYGFAIGMFGILIRVINPAYPEGWMLAILFMNMFAPLIDWFFKQSNIKRRLARHAA